MVDRTKVYRSINIVFRLHVAVPRVGVLKRFSKLGRPLLHFPTTVDIRTQRNRERDEG